MATVDEMVLATLEAARAPMSVSEIAKQAARGETSVREACQRLERARKITSDSTGRSTLWSFNVPSGRREGRVPATKKAAAKKTAAKKTAGRQRQGHVKPGHSAGVKRQGSPGSRQACAARDEKVRQLLLKHPKGLSRQQVMAKLDLHPTLAYNSLGRLRIAGEAKLERDGTRVPRWVAV